MSFLYPRTIEIRRIKTVAGSSDAVGDVGYSGEVDSTTDPNGEQVLFTGISCSIQADSPGRPRGSSLPTDPTSHPRWKVFIPGALVPKGAIRDRDILVDDESYRYQVIQAYWTPLGYSMPCLRSEA